VQHTWKWPTSSTEAIIEAVLPMKVLRPWSNTTAIAFPEVTVDPILVRLPTRIETGSDSPVSGAWSTLSESLSKPMTSQSP
jgi:hypothetical protein